MQQIVAKNNRLQVQSMTSSTPLMPFNGQPFLSHTYSFINPANTQMGNNGNIWGITDTLNNSRSGLHLRRPQPGQQLYAGRAPNQTYSIDSFGNLTGMAGGSPISTVDSATNRVNNLPCAASVQAYDAAGNQLCDNDPISGAIRVFTADAESRISSISMLGSSTPFAGYVYGADGARVRKNNTDGTFTEYVNFRGQVLAEKDQNGNWTDYVYGNGDKIAMVQGGEANNSSSWGADPRCVRDVRYAVVRDRSAFERVWTICGAAR